MRAPKENRKEGSYEMKETLAIYGSGTIGACLATLTTGNGFPTVVIGHSSRGIEQCLKTVERNWDDLIKEGLVSNRNKIAAMNLLHISSEPAALEPCMFVYESVSETLEIKRDVYRQIEQYCKSDTIIASTTSSIDAQKLAELLERPERFLIAHPFQPAHLLPLVEVVRHEKTSPDALAQTKSLLNRLKREIVVLHKSVPGFLVNRFAQALFRESIDLIEREITTPADIDRAVKYAIGMRYSSIGLLEYFDAVGFELERAIAENIYPNLCCTKDIQKTVLDGIAQGKTGQSAGQGIYDWSNIDQEDFRHRKQSPYFSFVQAWDLPGDA